MVTGRASITPYVEAFGYIPLLKNRLYVKK